MIISRTPLRISFAGGGTDLREYYERDYGAVLSTAIDKYVYITINSMFDDGLRVKYSQTENVKSVDEIKHPLFRETMRLVGVSNRVEITSMADVPSRGAGLGSSSAFTVGLLNALYSFKGIQQNAEKLAREACKIEIDILKEPIGKQDQYITAYGNFEFIKFMPDETVQVNPVVIKKNIKEEMQNNMSLFFTGKTRDSSSILSKQRERTKEREKFDILTEMRDTAIEMKEVLQKGDTNKFGELLHKGWMLKKKVTNGISNPIIDSIYEKARKVGATGGKVCGAGGGGFVLIYAPDGKIKKVGEALKDFRELKFGFEPQGSKIIFIES